MRYLVTFVTLTSIHRHLQTVEVEKRVMCHCFWFKGGTDSSPKETGRTVHDAFLGCARKVTEACGEAVKGFEEIGEAPF